MSDILCLDAAVTNDKCENPLLPVNFVSTPIRIVIDHEHVVTTDKEGNLNLKPSKNRPTPDNISVGQWTAANSRTLSKLIPTFSAHDLVYYLYYTWMICYLLTQFTNSSVFILDNDHRVEVNQTGRTWNNINCTLDVYTLKRRDDQYICSNHVYSTTGAVAGSCSTACVQPRTNQNQPRYVSGLCWDYNSKEGCSYCYSCLYVHKDSA